MIYANQGRRLQQLPVGRMRGWVISALVLFSLALTPLHAQTELGDICGKARAANSEKELQALERLVAGQEQWVKQLQKDRARKLQQAQQAREQEADFKKDRDEIDRNLRTLQLLFEQEKSELEAYYFQRIGENRDAIRAAEKDIGNSMSDIRVARHDIQLYSTSGHGMQVKSAEARIKAAEQKIAAAKQTIVGLQAENQDLFQFLGDTVEEKTAAKDAEEKRLQSKRIEADRKYQERKQRREGFEQELASTYRLERIAEKEAEVWVARGCVNDRRSTPSQQPSGAPPSAEGTPAQEASEGERSSRLPSATTGGLESSREWQERWSRRQSQRAAEVEQRSLLQEHGVFGAPMQRGSPAWQQARKAQRERWQQQIMGEEAAPTGGTRPTAPASSPTAAAPASTVASQQEQPLNLAGTWELEWTWTVTTVYFTGTVSGGQNQWTFRGTIEGRDGNALWTPKAGEASIYCSLSGNMKDAQDSSASMSCNASYSWKAQTTGNIRGTTLSNQRKFRYEGKGSGTNDKGEKASVDRLVLRPVSISPPPPMDPGANSPGGGFGISQ